MDAETGGVGDDVVPIPHPYPPDELGLTRLGQDICLELLSASTIGRLALTFAALPLIVPVMFSLEGTSIVLAADGGPEGAAVRADAVATLLVDDFRPSGGWSVLATGPLKKATTLDGDRFPSPLSRSGSTLELPITMLSGWEHPIRG